MRPHPTGRHCRVAIVTAIASVMLAPAALAGPKPTHVEMHVSVRIHIPRHYSRDPAHPDNWSSFDQTASAEGATTTMVTSEPGRELSIPFDGTATEDWRNHYSIQCFRSPRTFSWTDATTGTANLIHGGVVKPVGRGSVALLHADGDGRYTVYFTYGTSNALNNHYWTVHAASKGDLCDGEYHDLEVPSAEPRTYIVHADLADGHASGHYQPERWFDVTWSIDVGTQLEANPGGPYAVARGSVQTLDASKSYSSPSPIKRYVWKLTPRTNGCELKGDEEPHAVTRTTTTPKLRIASLCPIGVKLTVYNRAGRRASASTTLTPSRRPWRTAFEQDPPAAANLGPPIFAAAVGTRDYECLRCLFGRNVSDDYLPPPPGRSDDYLNHWVNPRLNLQNLDEPRGYTPTKIQDDGGPFDGWWYVASPKLTIHRLALVSRDLWPGGLIYEANGGDSDVRGLLEDTKAHEQAHGDLAKEAYDRNPDLDPERAIEPMVSASEDNLVQSANPVISNTDIVLNAHSTDAHVHARLVELGFTQSAIVLMPVSGTNSTIFKPLVIGELAGVGDNGP